MPESDITPAIKAPVAEFGGVMSSIPLGAEHFGRSPRTVRWWLASGRLPVEIA